jgi:trehalose 2-sulfotransferase
MMRAGKCVILCATQRTGSTLVFDDLLNVVAVERKDSEILYSRIVLQKTQRPWSEVWNEVRNENQVHGYFVGKTMFHYTPIISSFIERSSTAGVTESFEFVPKLFDDFYHFFASAVWVYVYRRDVFAQAVSMYLAETTNIWEKLVEPPQDGVPIPGLNLPEVRYEYEKLKAYLEGFRGEAQQWQLFFRHYKIAPIAISYEEAAAGYPHYLKELLDKTGLRSVEPPPPRRMLKLGDQRNEQWAELFRKDYFLLSRHDDKSW